MAHHAAPAALILLAALGAAACAGGGEADVAAGEALFQRTCAACHGADARGRPALGKSLHDNAFVQQLSRQELVDFIKKGRPAWDPMNTRGIDMPPRGGNPALTDQDLAEIARFVQSLQP